MNGLLPEEEIQNKSSDEPWRRSETDKLLDLYFAGTAPDRLAHILHRTPKAIRIRLEEFTYNQRDRVLRYQPRQRTSRIGKRLTENERVMIEAHKKRNVPTVETAKVLQRELKELGSDLKEVSRAKNMARFIPTVDLVLAYRYCYYVIGKPVVSDSTYDELKAEEMELGPASDLIGLPASNNNQDYPQHIRSLASYFLFHPNGPLYDPDEIKKLKDRRKR